MNYNNNNKAPQDILDEIGYKEYSFKVNILDREDLLQELAHAYHECSGINRAVDSIMEKEVEENCNRWMYSAFGLEDQDYDDAENYFKFSEFFSEGHVDDRIMSTFLDSTKKFIILIVKQSYYDPVADVFSPEFDCYCFNKEKFEEKCKEYGIEE